MNGAAAHLIKAGEEIIIMGFELSDEPITPQVIMVDQQNQFVTLPCKRIACPRGIAGFQLTHRFAPVPHTPSLDSLTVAC